MKRKSVKDLMLAKWNQATGCPHDTWEEAARCFYKYTACGPWLKVEDGAVLIGSIVEGVEQTTETHVLVWPFKVDRVRTAIKAVEDEAQEIWDQTHGCDECGPEDESGYRAINPNCKSCKGEGTIL